MIVLNNLFDSSKSKGYSLVLSYFGLSTKDTGLFVTILFFIANLKIDDKSAR